MGTTSNFSVLCRLCGEESSDLIALFGLSSGDRNLVPLIKKYVKITVNIGDPLPHQVCGPCVAKLDEVIDFVDASATTQNKLRGLVQEIKKKVAVGSDDNNDVVDEDTFEYSGPTITIVKEEITPTDEDDPDVYEPEAENSWESEEREMEDDASDLHKSKKKKDQVKEEGKDSAESVDFGQDLPRQSESAWRKTKNRLRCVVRCSLCEVTLDSYRKLKDHANQSHPSEEEAVQFMCPLCPQKFKRFATLRSHHKRKHEDLMERCPKCDKCFMSHYLWNRHMLVHTDSRPFSCTECDKKFKSKAEVQIHLKTHQPREERNKFCCELCGKSFVCKGNLETHRLLHTDVRPFSCEFCGKSFAMKGNMEEHRRASHTGERPFICNVCGEAFKRQSQLKRHGQSKHTGEKPYKCRYCGKQFLRREVMKKHENVHTDTRPFKCCYCPKAFRDQGKRKVHERIHTGERPYKCHLCSWSFCESGNLKKHLRVHQCSNSSIRQPSDALTDPDDVFLDHENTGHTLQGQDLGKNLSVLEQNADQNLHFME